MKIPKILKTYIAYSHRPGFRRFGRAWDKEPITVGEVEALPDNESRGHDKVDLLATSQEIARLVELNREEAYPLRIAEGATDPTARAGKEARRELEQIRAAIAEAREEREAAEKEAEASRRAAEELSAEFARLEDASKAAEKAARDREAEAETLKAEIVRLCQERDECKKPRPARKGNAKD